MAKKGDKDKVSDAEASFFGDDLDWLDEDDPSAEAHRESKAAAERLPVAPANVPTAGAAALGKFGDAIEPDKKPSKRRAPMPTLPPTPSMLADLEKDDASLPTVVDRTEDLPVPPAPAKLEEVPDVDMPTQEDSTLEIDPASDELRAKGNKGPASDLDDVGFADDLDNQEAVPLVRTHEPPPARASTVPPANRRGKKATNLADEPTFTPPVEAPRPRPAVAMPPPPPEPLPEEIEAPREVTQEIPAAEGPATVVIAAAPTVVVNAPEPVAAPAAAVLEPVPTPQPVVGAPRTLDEALPPMNSLPPMPALLERWMPQGDEQEWRDGATALVAEAASLQGVDRARCMLEAARIYRSRLGDRAGAEALFQDALAAGLDDAALRGELAEAAGRAQRWDEMVEHLSARAKHQQGSAAAETWQRAALVARQHLGKPEKALELLHHAVQADADDYAAWCMLRDALSEVGGDDERVRALGRIAELGQAAGAGTERLAADAWWEQGRVLQRMQKVADATHAFERARQADHGHVPSFLALEGLLSGTGNEVALAGLYESEGQNDATADGALWILKAARHYASAGQIARADAAYAAGVSRGSVLARREQQAWLAKHGRLADLAAALSAEADSADPSARPFLLWRVGLVKEQAGDLAGAKAAWAKALELDAQARPASDAIARLAHAAGDPVELKAAAERRVAAAADDEARAVALISQAELLERLGDAGARALWEKVSTVGGHAVGTALGALGRMHRRAAAWEDYAAICERQAEISRDPTEKALHLYRAATAGAPAVDAAKSRERLQAAVAAAPGFRPAVDAWIGILETEGDHAGIAAALDATAEATSDPVRKASALARAARVAADRLADPERAQKLAHAAIEAVPGYPAAVAVQQELAARGGASKEAWESWRSQAASLAGSGRVWALLAAAEVASRVDGLDPRPDLLAALGEDPANSGVLAALELNHLVRDDAAGLLDAYRRALQGSLAPERRAELLVRVAELHHELEQQKECRSALEDLRLIETGRPVRLPARMAEAMAAWELAAALLSTSDAPEDRLQRARLLGQRLSEPRQALVLYRELLDDPTWAAVAAAGAAGVAQRAGDLPTVVRVHQILAEGGHAPAMRAAYASWTAGLLESQDRAEEASRYWRLALEGRPKSDAAFEGARRTLASIGDAEGLRALFAQHRPDDRIGLADALEEDGDDAGAAQVWRAALDSGAPPKDSASAAALPTLIRLERVLARTEDWSGVYDVLTRRRELTKDEGTRAAIDAKRRWVLSEKLAATDMAWELYRQLHDEQPGDRDVTEALARIAGARGETALSIQYLKELAESAPSREDSARYQRRIAEVYERANDVASARQAYLDALDHVPDDRDALVGLRRLAEQHQDWQGLVAVLQREAGLARGARRLEVRRDIARVTEEKLKDPAVAMDAWRSVLEEAPQDDEALTKLLGLAEAQKEWALFVEVGKTLSAHAAGSDRAALLRRIGIASQVELSRDDAVRYFEAAISEAPPDAEAARRLEEIYRSRGDWPGCIRCLEILASVSETPAEKADHLQRAARIHAEVRHDKASAAQLYDRILEVDPTHEAALKFQAEHLFSGERTDAALPVYERLQPYMERTQDLDDFDTRMELSSFYFRFAQLLKEAGRADDALERYNRALELNPAHLPSLEAVGPLYIARKQWKDAEKVYRQLLQLTGGHGDNDRIATMYAELGVVERALGNSDKAQKRFAKALELHPNHVGGLKGMALLLEDRQDWPNLLNIYNNVIYHAVSADDVIHAYVTKGRILDQHMQRPDKAHQHYDGALAIDPAQPIALARLAELFTRKGEWAAAGEVAERGLSGERPAQAAGLGSGGSGQAIGVLHLVRAGARQAAGDAAGAAVALEAAWAAHAPLKDAAPSTAPEVLQAAIRGSLPT